MSNDSGSYAEYTQLSNGGLDCAMCDARGFYFISHAKLLEERNPPNLILVITNKKGQSSVNEDRVLIDLKGAEGPKIRCYRQTLAGKVTYVWVDPNGPKFYCQTGEIDKKTGRINVEAHDLVSGLKFIDNMSGIVVKDLTQPKPLKPFTGKVFFGHG